jgi:hypothetical protein
MYGAHEKIERQKLYDEVWSTPMLQLAKSFGISDRGLAKICERLNVPVPPRGYWRRKETGQDVSREPLPALREGQRDYVVYQRTIREDVDDPEAREHQEFEKRAENRINVASPGSEIHPIATKIRSALEKAKQSESGALMSDGEWCSLLAVSKGALERSLLIIDALFRTFEARGFATAFEKEKKTASVEIDKVRVTFALEEVLDRKERELTPAQQKDKIKNPWRYRYPEYFKVPSGRLCLKITHPTWGVSRLSWTDGKRQRVEDRLNDFMAAVRNEAVEQLRMEKHWEEQKRKREEEERLAEERRKRRLAEQRKLWGLLVESVNWQQSQQIRSYVEAIKRKAQQLGESAQQDQELNDWIEWALRQADSLDPLAQGAYCTRDDKRSSSSTDQHGEAKPHALDLAWTRMLRRSRHYEVQRERWGDDNRWPWSSP